MNIEIYKTSVETRDQATYLLRLLQQHISECTSIIIDFRYQYLRELHDITVLHIYLIIYLKL